MTVDVSSLLIVIALLLLGILLRLGKIDARLKERFPTEKERDRKWAQIDPMGHWEAHRKNSEPEEH